VGVATADVSTLSISTEATDPSVHESACFCLKTQVMSGAEREFQLSTYALFLEGENTSTKKENTHAATSECEAFISDHTS